MAESKTAANFAAAPLGAKVFLLFALLGVLTAGYYLALHMPLEDEITTAQRTNAQLTAELEQANTQRKKYLKLREELAGREALDRQNFRVLPVTAEIPAFLDDLNRLAELSGLLVDKVSPAPEEAEEFYIKVPVTLSLTGGYHQLAKFFYNISRLERAINMEDVKLTVESNAEASAESLSLSVGVQATTFRRKNEGT
ncbi:MAG: type 4a pilus biogenesis protein PilO [Myxococcales bacterium]|nr:type 4a pilus biogenesis protein PilO [Myxococcales bacterium]